MRLNLRNQRLGLKLAVNRQARGGGGDGAGQTAIIANGVLPAYATFTRASAARYHDANGIIQTAAIDSPRIDYIPSTGVLRGLLLEPAGENLALQSEGFSTASWAKTNATATADQIAAPDGQTTADLLTSTSTTGATTQQNRTLPASGTYTLSFYAKAGTATFFVIRTSNFDAGATGNTYFNLSTGAIGTTSANHVASIQALPSGWYRCAVAFSTTTDLIGTVQFYLVDADNSLNVTNGRTQYWWGAQLEAGGFPTSYIPTTTTAVTRSADVCSIADLTDISFNTAEGTLFVEGTTSRGIGASNISILSFNDGTADEVIALRRLTGGTTYDLLVTDGGVTQVDTAGFSVANATAFRSAHAYKVNDFAHSIAGAAAQTDNSGTVPTVDRLMLDAWNGWIKTLTYYPSVQDTQALTA